MQKKIVNGIETSYRFFGNSRMTKPTVLFIHGAAQSSTSWEYQYKLCKSYKKFNFIVIDLPGHGHSDGCGFLSIREYADFLLDFVNALDIADLVLVGHSMGGRIAQVYAINYPENIIGCVLAGSGAKLKVARATINMAEKDFNRFSLMAARNSFSDSASTKIREKFLAGLLDSGKSTCIRDFIACNEFDVTAEIDRISVPVLIIAGSEDILVPVKHSRFLLKNIQDSRLEIMEGAGHFMMMEKPGEFNGLLKIFFDFL